MAAARADGLVHLARCAWCAALVATTSGIRSTLPIGSPCSTAIRAASGLAESAAGIEVLLAGGKGKTLATIAAGQSHVARHVVDGSLKTNKNVRSARLAQARSPVDGFRRHEDISAPLRTRNSASRPSLAGRLARALYTTGSVSLGVITRTKRPPRFQRRPLFVHESRGFISLGFIKVHSEKLHDTLNDGSLSQSRDRPRFRIVVTRWRLGPEGRAACRC